MLTSTHLLRQRRFLPLFATQLLHAFNDNLFKTAMVLFVVYSVYNSEEAEAQFSAIASGLFILPGIAHAQAGPAVVVSYFIAALLALTGMLSQAELVSAMPKAGGDYFYVTRSMGPAVGTVDGLITWFSISLGVYLHHPVDTVSRRFGYLEPFRTDLIAGGSRHGVQILAGNDRTIRLGDLA